MAAQPKAFNLLRRDLCAGVVVVRVEHRLHLQAGARARATNQVHHRLEVDQWSASPVQADEREQTMLDLVPVARAGGIVADRDLERNLVGEPSLFDAANRRFDERFTV